MPMIPDAVAMLLLVFALFFCFYLIGVLLLSGLEVKRGRYLTLGQSLGANLGIILCGLGIMLMIFAAAAMGIGRDAALAPKEIVYLRGLVIGFIISALLTFFGAARVFRRRRRLF